MIVCYSYSANVIPFFIASEYYVIRKSSLEALELVSHAIALESIGALLLKYTDYICFRVSTNLHHRTKFIEGLEILSFALKYTPISSSTQLECILYSVIETWEKVYTIRNIKPILQVFNLFFKRILEHELNGSAKFSGNKVPEDLVCSDIHKSDLTTDILNAVLKVLSSSDRQHQIMCLDCLISGLPCLKSKDSLLRICHLIWTPLVEKFKSKCLVTVLRCFELLVLLSSLARDFLRQRICR